MTHVLDRPIWHTLNGAHLALGMGGPLARRFRPDIHILGAAAHDGPAAQTSLASLVPAEGELGVVEPVPPPPLTGARQTFAALLDQMHLVDWTPPEPRDTGWQPLGEADAEDMLELATLTKPGPYVLGTHRLGDFVGIRRDGKLVAMAGERMKPPGYTEVSAVCTHPDARGHGYGAQLMAVVIKRALARGDGVFLHAFPGNSAIAIYEALGFRKRRDMHYVRYARA
ncbi:MAG TPA: GNAT family N-acetyltransferase [Sphingomonas sp.]|nr:GNAT family N-acetyltransferase [Sphingomonas sp.]